jgi:hypothetical protein
MKDQNDLIYHSIEPAFRNSSRVFLHASFILSIIMSRLPSVGLVTDVCRYFVGSSGWKVTDYPTFTFAYPHLKWFHPRFVIQVLRAERVTPGTVLCKF